MLPVVTELGQVTAAAGHVLTPIWSLVSGFLILIVLMAVLLLFSRYMGYGPFISLLASFYIGYAFYAAFPYRSLLPTAPPESALTATACVYFAFVLIAYIILRRVAASDFVHVGLFGLILLSFLGAAFLIALAYDEFPVRAVYAFTPALDQLFAAKDYFFWWFAGPLIGLFYLAIARY
jgi:hypothetical protein